MDPTRWLTVGAVLCHAALVVPGAQAQRNDGVEAAMGLSRAGQHAEAAILLQRIVDGDVAAQPRDVRAAQAQLARELHVLGFRQSAVTLIADQVDARPGSAELRGLVPLLAELATEMPSASPARDFAGRVSEADLVAASGLDAAALARMRWLRGRHQYHEGSFDEAVATLEAIPADTPYYVASHLLAAGAHVRQRAPGRAARMFRAVVDHLGPRPPTPRRRDARVVAMLNLARLYYERAVARPDPRSFAVAAALFATVPRTSRHYAQAQLGLAWTAFAAGAPGRSMRALDALPASSLEREGEGAFLRVLVELEQCHVPAARAAIAAQRARAERTRAAMQAFFARASENIELVELIRSFTASRPVLDAFVEVPLRAALADENVRSQLVYLDMLESEERALAAMPAAFRDTPVAARILQDVSLAKSFAFDNISDLVRMRVMRWADERDEDAQSLAALGAEHWICPGN